MKDLTFRGKVVMSDKDGHRVEMDGKEQPVIFSFHVTRVIASRFSSGLGGVVLNLPVASRPIIAEKISTALMEHEQRTTPFGYLMVDLTTEGMRDAQQEVSARLEQRLAQVSAAPDVPVQGREIIAAKTADM